MKRLRKRFRNFIQDNQGMELVQVAIVVVVVLIIAVAVVALGDAIRNYVNQAATLQGAPTLP